MSDTLERIAKLLHKAEHAATTEESNAYQAKAQEIATRAAIDLEMARAHNWSQVRKPKLVQEVLTMGPRGKKGLHTYVTLFIAIAEQNNVHCTITQDSVHLYAYGFDTDIEVTRVLYESLLTQMVRESDVYIRSKKYREELVWSERKCDMVPVHGTTARQSFQKAFASRIRTRLRDARQQAEKTVTAQDTSNSTALAIVNRAQVAHTFYQDATRTIRGTYRAGRANASSRSATAAGREAGDRARLRNATPVGGSRAQLPA